MVRRRMVIGNWKMNGLRRDLGEVQAIARAAAAHPQVDVALCLPFTLLAHAVTAAPRLTIGAQDCHAAESGAHTGCTSAAMLADAGARMVLVGHSERRAEQFENSRQAWAKTLAAHRHGLRVILCCGETEAERDSGRAERVVEAQIEKAVPPEATADWFTLAYEPRWAIGTGRTPSIDDIAAIHAIARAKLQQIVGADAARQICLLYGGSLTDANAAAIFDVPNVDGGLVGGASLTAARFFAIIEAAGAKDTVCRQAPGDLASLGSKSGFCAAT